MPPSWLWAYWVPLGILLLIWGGLPPQKARRVTPLAMLAIALSVLGYWAVGFAFHMGGAHAVQPEDLSLQGLDVLLPLVRHEAGWGFVGLSGFFLSGDQATPSVIALFLAYLPMMVTAVLLVTLALAHERRWLMVVAGALAGTVVVPVAACWMWGSGWLSHLGYTLELGHGLVDFGGSGLVFGVPGMMTLGILLCLPRRTDESEAGPPPAYFPLLAQLGVLFIGLGWIGWVLGEPFHVGGAQWDWNRTAMNVLLGMTAAILTSQFYAWLVSGEPEGMLAARGMTAAWAVLLAGAPFVPPWAAMVLGLLAGLLFPFIHYAVETWLRLRDSAAAIAIGLTGGVLGLLGPAVFADGRWGQGWNGIGAINGSGSPVTGVAGLISGGGSGQFIAQLAGIAALCLWGLLWGLLLGFIANPRLPRLPKVHLAQREAESEEAPLLLDWHDRQPDSESTSLPKAPATEEDTATANPDEERTAPSVDDPIEADAPASADAHSGN